MPQHDQFAQEFMTAALALGLFEESSRRLRLDPYFGGWGGPLQMAARACREQIANPRHGLYEAQMLMSFEHATYPLTAAAALPFRGADALRFATHASHARYPRDFLQGKKVVIFGTLEEDTRFVHAASFIADYGGEVLGAVMLLSSSFHEEHNQGIPFPIVRVLREEAVRHAWRAEMRKDMVHPQ